jgi:hypothetical protein
MSLRLIVSENGANFLNDSHMKILMATIGMMASLSFSMEADGPNKLLTTTNNSNSLAGNAWKVEQTFILNNLTLYNCKEEPIYFETFMVTQDLHGVNNNNVSVIQGKGTMEGTGYNLATGEVYQFKAESWSSGKFPITGGAIALTSMYKGGFVGDQESKTLSYIRSHTTITPTGKIIAFDINPETICQ